MELNPLLRFSTSLIKDHRQNSDRDPQYINHKHTRRDYR
jgi:hypothetical protein